MAVIPLSVDREFVSGIERVFRGKVRDTYILPNYPGHLLIIASDRISVYDFVLPSEIPQKGEILTAMNIFWRKEILEEWGYEHDLVSFGSHIDEFLPENLRSNPELHKRATVVEKLLMCDFEAIVRGYLTGSGLAAYKETSPHEICGHHLPDGFTDGSELPFALFTPSTKEREGHDQHVTTDWVIARYGYLPERLSLQLYHLGKEFSKENGIIIADTKFELGYEEGRSSKLRFGDEVFTPDSSRFWDVRERKKAIEDRRSPQSLDKQYIRNWAKTQGVDRRDPKILEDVTFVHALTPPLEVVNHTYQIYRYIFWRITSKKLERFQHEDMEIELRPPLVRLDLVLGSRSDLAQASAALERLDILRREGVVAPRVHIVSCHRHPEGLRRYVEELRDVDVIVAGAGKAAALPGVLKSWLRFYNKNRIPVIGVAFEGNTAASTLAAKLSIEELPEQSVLLDDGGDAYVGASGCFDACERAVMGEFLPEGNWRAFVEPEFDLAVWK